MFDAMFSFMEPMEGDLFQFVDQVEALFESPERFLSEYQRLSMANPGEERQKNLDLYIGLALIGPHGREQMYERLRLIYEKRKNQ